MASAEQSKDLSGLIGAILVPFLGGKETVFLADGHTETSGNV